jgi:hypothetical protein
MFTRRSLSQTLAALALAVVLVIAAPSARALEPEVKFVCGPEPHAFFVTYDPAIPRVTLRFVVRGETYENGVQNEYQEDEYVYRKEDIVYFG